VEGLPSTTPSADIITRVLSPTVHSLLCDQAGIVTREQVRTGGVPVEHIKAQISARRWRALNESVICSHNGPLTADQARSAVASAAPAPPQRRDPQRRPDRHRQLRAALGICQNVASL
jgi:hypothetical protein